MNEEITITKFDQREQQLIKDIKLIFSLYQS